MQIYRWGRESPNEPPNSRSPQIRKKCIPMEYSRAAGDACPLRWTASIWMRMSQPSRVWQDLLWLCTTSYKGKWCGAHTILSSRWPHLNGGSCHKLLFMAASGAFAKTSVVFYQLLSTHWLRFVDWCRLMLMLIDANRCWLILIDAD